VDRRDPPRVVAAREADGARRIGAEVTDSRPGPAFELGRLEALRQEDRPLAGGSAHRVLADRPIAADDSMAGRSGRWGRPSPITPCCSSSPEGVHGPLIMRWRPRAVSNRPGSSSPNPCRVASAATFHPGLGQKVRAHPLGRPRTRPRACARVLSARAPFFSCSSEPLILRLTETGWVSRGAGRLRGVPVQCQRSSTGGAQKEVTAAACCSARRPRSRMRYGRVHPAEHRS
jgi:hypothetical protein